MGFLISPNAGHTPQLFTGNVIDDSVTSDPLAGTVNDLNVDGAALVSMINLPASAPATVNSLVGGVSGRRLRLANISAFDITLSANTGGTASNRFFIGVTLVAGSFVDLVYSGALSRWILIVASGGAFLTTVSVSTYLSGNGTAGLPIKFDIPKTAAETLAAVVPVADQYNELDLFRYSANNASQTNWGAVYTKYPNAPFTSLITAELRMGSVRPEWFAPDMQILSGITNASPYFTNAITFLSTRNPQGISGVGYGTGTLLCDAKVYRFFQTVTFLPFINYVGIRATTANAGADFTDMGQSRGTIFRADPLLFTAVPAGVGVLFYVPTGDAYFEKLTFVGTASINSNSSIGIQWGSTGGVANTGRPFEIDGTGQNCSGIGMRDCTFYTFSAAWENNWLNDCFTWNVRYESNVIDIYHGGNSQNNTTTSFEQHGCVHFGYTYADAYQPNKAGRTVSHVHKYIGGVRQSSNVGNAGVVYLGVTLCPNIDLEITDCAATISGTSTPRHLWLDGNFDNATINIRYKGGELNGGNILVQRSAGTALPVFPDFDSVRFNGVAVITNIATRGRIFGSLYNTTFNISNHTNGEMNVCWYDTAGVAINFASTDCGAWRITPHFMNCNANPITVTNHPTNATIVINQPIGMSAPPACGIFICNSPIAFASLGTPSNGSMVYCNDGQALAVVIGGGTGCFAKRINSVWVGN